MKQAERLAKIEQLTKITELYAVKRKAGELSGEEARKYAEYLRELARVKRIEAGFESIFAFGKTYFSSEPPHDLINPETPSPPFHRQLCDMLRETAMSVESRKLAVCAPRSHAKSVWITNIFPVWLACYKDDIPTAPYWIIVGDDVDSARKQLDVVKMAFMSNALIIEDFGSLVGATWNSYEIITSNGVKFEAAGIKQGIRGTRFGSHRPSKLYDDIETDESCHTPERIETTVNKFDRTFIPLGDPKKSKDVLVGTIINYGSLLNRIMKDRGEWRKIKYRAVIEWPDRMDLWQRWEDILKDRSEGESAEQASEIAYRKAREFYEENREEMERGSVVLWPERIGLYELMVLRATNRMAFNSEQQSEPLDADTKLFDPSKFKYYKVEDINYDDLDFYYACDPSMGKNKRADFSAIIVVAKHRKNGLLFVIEADVRRRSPDQIILDIFEKHKRYRFKGGWVEGVAFQSFFRSEVQRRAAESGVYVPADEFPNKNRDKDARIAGMEPMITNGYVRFLPTMTELMSQLEFFPKHDRKDGPDALSMVLEMVSKRSSNVVFGKL